MKAASIRVIIELLFVEAMNLKLLIYHENWEKEEEDVRKEIKEKFQDLIDLISDLEKFTQG